MEVGDAVNRDDQVTILRYHYVQGFMQGQMEVLGYEDVGARSFVVAEQHAALMYPYSWELDEVISRILTEV